jgi:hypothetical protein
VCLVRKKSGINNLPAKGADVPNAPGDVSEFSSGIPRFPQVIEFGLFAQGRVRRPKPNSLNLGFFRFFRFFRTGG